MKGVQELLINLGNHEGSSGNPKKTRCHEGSTETTNKPRYLGPKSSYLIVSKSPRYPKRRKSFPIFLFYLSGTVVVITSDPTFSEWRVRSKWYPLNFCHRKDPVFTFIIICTAGNLIPFKNCNLEYPGSQFSVIKIPWQRFKG